MKMVRSIPVGCEDLFMVGWREICAGMIRALHAQPELQLAFNVGLHFTNCKILDLKQKDGVYVALCLEILELEVVAALAAG